MASKIYDFNNKSVVLSLGFGVDSAAVTFKQGKAVVHDPEIQAMVEKWLEATSAGMYEIRDYDPAVEQVVIHTVGGTNQGDNLIQGIVTSLGKNPAIAELDSQLAQALVSGTVDELVAANPEALEGAGFVANTAPAPTKPQLGAKPAK